MDLNNSYKNQKIIFQLIIFQRFVKQCRYYAYIKSNVE